jgi:LPS O-antigen subunit length determinant protein (WzzB/FepE family)
MMTINGARDIEVRALKEKAANARGKTKAAIEARVTQINNAR